ncbi:MAG TPA: DUF167 family protein [Hyphomicrobiaceae bacterium]|nr:DUF167 family protein [Hyphomicrobiaceae bacterium]
MTEHVARPWHVEPAGLKVLVRVTPKSARDGVEGIVATAQGPALAVRVRDVPQDGEANRAVERTFAEWLGVPRSTVALRSGTRSRVKTLVVTGDATQLSDRVQSLAERSR